VFLGLLFFDLRQPQVGYYATHDATTTAATVASCVLRDLRPLKVGKKNEKKIVKKTHENRMEKERENDDLAASRNKNKTFCKPKKYYTMEQTKIRTLFRFLLAENRKFRLAAAVRRNAKKC